MRTFIMTSIFIITMIMFGCSNMTKPEPLIQLPDGYLMTVNLGDSLSILFKNDSNNSAGYQIKDYDGGIYFQDRFVAYDTEHLMYRGQTDGYVNNPLLIDENPPFDKWLDFNFAIYNNERWPSDYRQVGHWYFNPDFWPALQENYYSSMCLRYEWKIKIFSDGTYVLKER